MFCLGAFPQPFGHRPELMCVLHRVYKWKSSLQEGMVYKIPGDIRDEILMATIFLGLAHAHLQTPVESVLRATDATPRAYGSCSAPCPPKVLRALYRTHRHRGKAGRLDWGGGRVEWIPTHMPAADGLTNRSFLTLKWKSHLSGHFPRTAHINLQEMRALKLDF